MKDEGRRRRIEQLRIVDAEHSRTIPGPRAQLLAAASQQRVRALSQIRGEDYVIGRYERVGRMLWHPAALSVSGWGR